MYDHPAVAFHDDMLTAMGINDDHPDLVQQGLGHRLEELAKETRNKKSTFEQYITLQNLYLVRENQ